MLVLLTQYNWLDDFKMKEYNKGYNSNYEII